MMSVLKWAAGTLADPLTRGRDLDDPSTTLLRRHIIGGKRPLQDIYREWYGWLAAQLPPGPGRVLELGSGAGFIREVIPDVIASDVMPVPGLDLVMDARQLPFAPGALRAIVMTNVLHHVPDVKAFLRGAQHVVREGGVIAMVEPWVTRWSSLVYRRLHHEPFAIAARDWVIEGAGPLSAANSALPWILFDRDRDRFERMFPKWRIASISMAVATPFRYVLSGGVSLRLLAPKWSFGAFKRLERCVGRWPGWFGMFAGIVLVREA
jgi:SAM-dependent methyltransferase